jgi:hypothetical protein
MTPSHDRLIELVALPASTFICLAVRATDATALAAGAAGREISPLPPVAVQFPPLADLADAGLYFPVRNELSIDLRHSASPI